LGRQIAVFSAATAGIDPELAPQLPGNPRVLLPCLRRRPAPTPQPKRQPQPASTPQPAKKQKVAEAKVPASAPPKVQQQKQAAAGKQQQQQQKQKQANGGDAGESACGGWAQAYGALDAVRPSGGSHHSVVCFAPP
jgi:hypothetical protein